jgi:tetratricopeptide (TPR) repeat protein
MDLNSRVLELVMQYEELKSSGKSPTAEELCRDCPELRGELERRLVQLAALRPALEETPLVAGDSWATTPPAETSVGAPPSPAGRLSNRYTSLRFHARGGLGEVHVAHDREVGRNVALKRIQPRHSGNADSRNRFLREAEITGRLEHPGIVPVYGVVQDADGQPCYAMRFIEGETLQEAVRRFHEPNPDFGSLACRELLQRFVAVCNTMAYAHSRGVIHRDLKPANIMLGPFGETLVVDWGLAKVMGQEEPKPSEEEPAQSGGAFARLEAAADVQTHAGQALGTPVFMSPEQAAGRWPEVGAASDIYSLGATLYAMLTGRPPIEGTDWAAMKQQIIAGAVRPPRAWCKAVPRPLEAICLKALAPDRAARYASARELAKDVERWLADEPVAAWREPRRVRARRWARRHRVLVTALAAALLVLTASSWVGATLLAHKNAELKGTNEALQVANTKEQQARTRSDKALMFFVDVFRRPDPTMDGKKITIYESLTKAVDRLKTSDQDADVRATLLNSVGQTYAGLGEFSAAVPVHALAFRLREQELGRHDSETLTSMHNLATAQFEAGQFREAIPLLEEAAPLLEAHWGRDSRVTINVLKNLSVVYKGVGRLTEAVPLMEDSFQRSQRAEGPDSPLTLQVMISLATLYGEAGRLKEAQSLLEEAVPKLESLLGPGHPNTLNAKRSLARAYREMQRPAEALPLLKAVLKQEQDRLGEDHHSTLDSLVNLGVVLMDLDRVAEAVPLLEKALQQRRGKLDADGRDTLGVVKTLAGCYQKLGRPRDAFQLQQQTIEEFTTRVGPDHPDTLEAVSYQASLHQRYGQLAEAIRLYRQILPGLRQHSSPQHTLTMNVLNDIGESYHHSRRFREAIPVYEEALELRRAKLGPAHRDTLVTANNLATAYKNVGRFAEALALFEPTLNAQRELLGPANSSTLQTMGNMAGCLMAMRRFESAVKVLRECSALQAQANPGDWTTFHLKNGLGVALFQLREYAEAETALRESYEGLVARKQQMPAPYHVFIDDTALNLVKLYEAWNKPAQADEWQRKLPPVEQVKHALECRQAWPLLWGWSRF